MILYSRGVHYSIIYNWETVETPKVHDGGFACGSAG